MYSLDSPHLDRLRCDRCGHALRVALDAWDDPESLPMLTEDEAATYFPDLAADLRLHGMLCPGRGSRAKSVRRRWRRRGDAAGGWGVECAPLTRPPHGFPLHPGRPVVTIAGTTSPREGTSHVCPRQGAANGREG
jgi:hypothetical protein